MKYYATSAAVAALVMGASLTDANAQDTLTQNARAAGIVEMDGRTVDELADAKADRAEAAQADAADEAAEPLAREDVLAEAADDFAAADTDGDDALSAEEYVAAMEPEVAAEPAVMTAETKAATETAEPDTIAAQLTAKFTAIAGEDGTLSAEELAAATEADFETADENADGALDVDEALVFASLTAGRSAG